MPITKKKSVKKSKATKEILVPHYLFIMKNHNNHYFLAGRYCTLDDFVDRLKLRYPLAEVVEAVPSSMVMLPVIEEKVDK